MMNALASEVRTVRPFCVVGLRVACTGGEPACTAQMSRIDETERTHERAFEW